MVNVLMQLETIEMEIKYIKEDIEEIKANTDKIMDMFNKLDDRYTTRREFNAVKWIVWVLVSVITLVNIVLSIKWW